MCGTLEGKISVWESSSVGYVPWSYLRPQLASKAFAFSSVSTSILSWGSQGFELLHAANSAGRTHIGTLRQRGSVVSRRETVEPSETHLYLQLPDAHESAVALLLPDMYPYTQGMTYRHGDRRACLPGTRETSLAVIKSWVRGLNSPPIFWLNGLVGTGKSAIVQAVVEWCNEQGILEASFSCSGGAAQRGPLRFIFPTLARTELKHCGVRLVLAPILDFVPGIVHQSPSSQLEKLIVMPLKPAGVPTVIIIDTLDNWKDDESPSPILSAMEHCTDEIPEVKFLIPSRPKTQILDSLCFPLFCGQADVLNLYDTAPSSVNSDIRLFLEHELSNIASRDGLDDWPTAAQLDLLVRRADGLFVYAAATAKFLGRKDTSPGELYASIAHSPRDTIHEGMMEGSMGG